MKIHFLGTCSGTEPMPGMHHCSLVMEVNNINYWFDAGENCSHTAYTSGLDIMQTKALFVSHPHIDHIGGLANLFFCFQKLNWFGKTLVNNNTLQIYFPDLDILDAVTKISGYSGTFEMQSHPLTEGIIFEDENVKVTAIHNCHIAEQENPDDWQSFSFLIETEDKCIVFSGDVRSPEELDALQIEGADVLIMETGHHAPVDVCEYARSRKIKNLRFNHHGRAILNNRPEMERMAEAYTTSGEISVKICYDGMVESF